MDPGTPNPPSSLSPPPPPPLPSSSSSAGNMSTRTFSQTAMAMTAHLPPAKRGPGFRSVSVASYSSSSTDPDDLVELPEDISSEQFLLYAGFNAETSRMIYNRWVASDPASGDSLVVYARSHVRSKARILDAVGPEDDWEQVLLDMGINDRLRAVMQDPEYDLVRFTRSASFWVIDTIREAEFFLRTVSKRMEQTRAQQLSRINTPDESIRPRRAIQDSSRNTSRASAASSSQIAPASLTVNTPPENLEGRNVYYKGAVEARFATTISSDGSLSLDTLFSDAPTDFHPLKRNYVYLTKHKDIAEIYANWAAERGGNATSAAIFHIALPSVLPSQPREIYGSDWRELVWHSRNPVVGRTTDFELPHNLRQYEDADILIGNICGDATQKIESMVDMSQLNELRRTVGRGPKASQLVMQKKLVRDQVQEQCKGFAWVTTKSR